MPSADFLLSRVSRLLTILSYLQTLSLTDSSLLSFDVDVRTMCVKHILLKKRGNCPVLEFKTKRFTSDLCGNLSHFLTFLKLRAE